MLNRGDLLTRGNGGSRTEDDGLSLPLTNEMDSDIVGETVVVTTSPEEEDVVVTTSPEEEDVNASGDSDLEELNEVDKESLMDKAAGGQSETVDAPDVESQAYTSQVSVDCVAVATTLQQLSCSGGPWTARGMLEDFNRLRDRLKKQEQRKNPEFRRRESAKAKLRMANKRNDPVLREIERRKDRERRALARQKAGVREKERKRDKLYKKLLRDRAKNAGVVEDDTLRGISDSTNMVIVYSGTCPVKTRVESESLSALNSLQQITVRDIICETASTSTRKGNEDHCVDEVKNCTETTISNSSPVLIDSNRTFESDSLADMELSESDTMRICNNGDVRTSNHGDSGETVRIINSESGEEVVLCTGDAIDEKTAMFIKNVILKTETVHSV